MDTPAIPSALAAIESRISCRSYEDKPVEPWKVDDLRALLDTLNADSGCKFQLYGPRAEGQRAIDLSSQMFAGPVYLYAALVASHVAIGGESVGYFGEKLVLRATQLGLGTCWVAGTFNRKTTRAEIPDGCRLWDVIPIGYAASKTPMKQALIRKGLRRSTKEPQAIVRADRPYDELPAWIRAGVDAILKGPSAVNRQPVVLTCSSGTGRHYSPDGWKISADVPDLKSDVQLNDLGIAKLHFELAAAGHGVVGTWEPGRGGLFMV